MNIKKGWNVESSSYTIDKKLGMERWNVTHSSIVKPLKIVRPYDFPKHIPNGTEDKVFCKKCVFNFSSPKETYLNFHFFTIIVPKWFRHKFF